MEKICIVRRRKKSTQELETETDYIADNEMIPTQGLNVISSHVFEHGIDVHEKKDYLYEDSKGDENQMISLNLTPEQGKLLRSSNFAQYLTNGISSGAALSVQQHEDGEICLNFHFDKVNTLRMLKSGHVCAMMQVSKSFLMKLVKEQKIKSYKIGRLRRFSLEDVLEYLTRNEEPGNPEYKA